MPAGEVYGDCCATDVIHSSIYGGMWGSCWYGGVYALVLDRDDEETVNFTARNTNPNEIWLSTNDARMDWTTAGEVKLGRYLSCCSAIELSYWNLDPDAEFAFAFDPNATGVDPDIIPVQDFTGLVYDDGGGLATVAETMDGARMHRLRRDYDFMNIELNLVNVRSCCEPTCLCSCSGTRSVHAMLGIRYFRFEDDFLFSADDADTNFTGAPEEIHYLIDVENQLLGAQAAVRGDYYWNPHAGVHFGAKGGIYGNHINHRSYIGGSAGVATAGGREFNVDSDATKVAFIGETEVAFLYQFSQHFRFKAGYRLIVLSGVATTVDQIPTDFTDIDSVIDINTESLLLHGGFLGLEFSM